MRRRGDALLPLERHILSATVKLTRRGRHDVHGFLIAKELQELSHTRSLAAHGTLYKALARLERSGLVTSRWEDPLLAAAARRPVRRLYRITAAGRRALADSADHAHPDRLIMNRRMAPVLK